MTELLQLSLGGAESVWLPPLLRVAAAVGEGGSGHALVGCFRAVVGPVNSAVLLMHHSSQDALLEAAETRRLDSACEGRQRRPRDARKPATRTLPALGKINRQLG